jgi:uridine kinase
MLAKIGEEEEQRSPLPPNVTSEGEEGVVLLEQTPQLLVRQIVWLWSYANRRQGIMTILRDRETERGDFIFYADRLSTLIVEKALTLLPHRPISVRTPVGVSYTGLSWPDDEVS